MKWMNEWMNDSNKYNLLIGVSFVTCRQKKRCWWGRCGPAWNVVLYIKLCRLKAPSVILKVNIMRVKTFRKCKHKNSTHVIQQWELWGMCLIIIKHSKHFLTWFISLDFGLNVTWTCSPENWGKHVHAHVIWKHTLTYWRVCEDLIPPVDENPHQHQQTQHSERGDHSQRNNRPLVLLCASHHPDTRLRTAVTRLWSEKQEQNCPWPSTDQWSHR